MPQGNFKIICMIEKKYRFIIKFRFFFNHTYLFILFILLLQTFTSNTIYIVINDYYF